MKSITKNLLSDEVITTLFAKAGFNNVSNISTLSGGFFNAVYSVQNNDKQYVLKVAPPAGVDVLTYEKGMMASEVYWYKRMREDTDILTPQIYYYDSDKDIIDSDFFIMEKIDGMQLNELPMSPEETQAAHATVAKMTASMHKVKNDKFGYVQQQLYDNWYIAIRSMTVSLIKGCEAKNRKSRQGQKLLKFIDANKNILEKVECCMVNYDIWFKNIMAKRQDDSSIMHWWIDPERCFWGDQMADFVCLENMHSDLSEKKIALDAYNSVADRPIEINNETNIRYAIMMAYMGLLMESEKYYRFKPYQLGWWLNILAGRLFFYRKGFGILKKLTGK